MNNKLFVGNLAFEVTENDLMDLFGQHGSVIEVNLVLDKFSGRSRGFAFVTMANDEDAQKAIEGLQGQNFHGRDLTVNVARPREERGGGGGGGGYRGGGGGGGGGRGGDRGGPRRERRERY
jgi:cold-inducible RNA-binding protein